MCTHAPMLLPTLALQGVSACTYKTSLPLEAGTVRGHIANFLLVFLFLTQTQEQWSCSQMRSKAVGAPGTCSCVVSPLHVVLGELLFILNPDGSVHCTQPAYKVPGP